MCSITDTSPLTAGGQPMSRSMVLSMLAALVVAVAWQNNVLSSFLPSFHLIVSVFGCIVCFLASLVCFVNFYIGKDLRKCSPMNEHLAYVNEETQSSQCIHDLDKVANPEGLNKMWKDLIHDKDVCCKILLTGVTGYVGRAFLFQLLHEIKKVEEEDGKKLGHKVFVMARAKARKNLTAAQRLEKIRDEPMFAPLKNQWDEVVVAAESGDLQHEKCGMSEVTLHTLKDAEITHIVHVAADVNFNRPLPESAAINISPALQLQALAAEWPSCKRFVHCSTAFVNPGTGSPDEPLPESLFSLGKYDPQELYLSMRGDQKLALEAKAELQFPNNYVFTKCVAEHLVSRNNKRMALLIVRPAIVGPAWVLPEPGWNGDKPSTITALFLLWGTRVIRFAPLNYEPTAMVPVDVVAVGIVDAMIRPTPKELPVTGPVSIHNLTWSHKSPNKFIDGVRMAKQCIPVGVLKHHFTATEAAVSFALIDLSSNYPFTYNFLHRVFNLGPLYLLQFVCWVAKMTGIKSILDQVPVVKLFNFSDMLTLYRPYLARAHFFESSINVPSSLNINQYCISLFTATHAFWSSMFPGTVEDLNELELIPKGRFDLWWALTLPCSSFKNRLIGYLACKIIRATYGSAEVNFVTLFHAGRTMLKLEESMGKQKHCVVLAPTHRSLMDYILVKYIAFSMVGLGLDVPTVFAEKEFTDSQLRSNISSIKSRYQRNATLAAFLEGKPSPDGRLLTPRTEFLQALTECSGEHDYHLIPLCIDYDRVDNDSDIMETATCNFSDLGLYEMFKLYWNIFMNGKSEQRFGDLRISFGEACELKKESDFVAVATHLQAEHRRLTTVSEFELESAENHLKIPSNILRPALEQLGATYYDNKKEEKPSKGEHLVELETKELWRLHMQWMYRFVPFLKESYPEWASWIMGGMIEKPPCAEHSKPSTNEVAQAFKFVLSILDAADSLAKRAEESLKKQGTTVVNTDILIQEMSVLDKGKNDVVNSPIHNAAASFVIKSKE